MAAFAAASTGQMTEREAEGDASESIGGLYGRRGGCYNGHR
jgi:hypothetical protein